MEKIRIGKDFTLEWTILTNGQPISLAGRNLRLEMHTPSRKSIDMPFTIDVTRVNVRISPDKQPSLGVYTFTLWENYGKDGQTMVDSCDAFQLVDNTCKENPSECECASNMQTRHVDLSMSDMTFSPIIKSSPIIIDDALSTTSTNPVQNKVITTAIKERDERIITIEANVDTNTTNITNLNKKIGINSSIGDNVSIPSNFQLTAMGEQVSVLTDRTQTNLNNFTQTGLYRLQWEVTESPEETNLPMLNHGGGNTIDAMLWVLDSSLPNIGAKDDDVCVTQFLMLSNRTGGAEGDMFMRSANGKTKDSLTWKRWEKYQTNVEVGMVISLDEFVDNGIYSGIYNQGGQPSEIETFVMLVINNYAVANKNKTITQIKYGTKVNGEFTMQTRSKGVATGGVWSEWQSVGGIDDISFSELYDTSAIKPRCFALAIENGNVVIYPIFANLNGNYEGLVKAGDVRQYVTNQIKQAITNTLNTEV